MEGILFPGKKDCVLIYKIADEGIFDILETAGNVVRSVVKERIKILEEAKYYKGKIMNIKVLVGL